MTAYDDGRVSVHLGDCLDVLRSLPDASVDAVVTDPPYGLEFMGKEWDSFGGDRRQSFLGEIQTPDNPYGRSTVRFAGSASYGAKVEGMRAFQDWCELWAAECLRVLKPGGHMLAFGGTRTWHRLACAVEDAGFEVRDSIAWLYGSGFPKSLDVSKAIDKAAGATREVVGRYQPPGMDRPWNLSQAADERDVEVFASSRNNLDITAPATPDAERWQGWGTALKPAFEPVVVARKPLQGTVAANVLAHGTGALNVDGCRVGSETITQHGRNASANDCMENPNRAEPAGRTWSGRWPANVVLDESQAAALDQMSDTGPDRSGGTSGTAGDVFGGGAGLRQEAQDFAPYRGGQGGASRFFYVAKAPKRERPRSEDGTAHPTVKPLDLMRWLVRLVTPPGGTVLEPFAGSGTTVEACIVEGFRCIAIEREPDYLPLILQRIHRRRDPVAAIRQTGDDLGLFELDGESA